MAFGDDSQEGFAEGEEPLHFYYNREERIKKAPRIVQEYYAGGGPRPTRGLFKVLVATRANRIVLFVMLACLLLVLFNGLMRGDPSKMVVENTTVQLSAFTFEDVVYVSIHLTPVTKKTGIDPADEQRVTAHLTAIDMDKQIVYVDDVSINYRGSEDFLRTKCTDYDILLIEADVLISGKAIHLKTPVQRH